MKLEDRLKQRSNNICEMCLSSGPVELFAVMPQSGATEANSVLVCEKCEAQLNKKAEPDSKHWEAALAGSMWGEVPGIQVLSWRMLNRFRNESWATDALDMLYLDEENLAWAKATGDHENENSVDLHKDSNGQILQAGDTVILTKSLDVKGSSLNAKLGTVVKNIRLVEDNTEQIEGKIEGQVIVILTRYVRKQN